MQLRRTIALLISSVSIGSLTLVGCTQQRQFDDMGEWKPERVVQVPGPVRQHTIYYWVVPENPTANLR